MKEKSRTGRPRSLPTPAAQKRALKERGIETKGLKQSTVYRRYNYYITQGHKTSEPVQKAYAQKRDWLGYIEKKGTKARVKTGKGYISAEDYMMEYQKEKETELQLPPNAYISYGNRYRTGSQRVYDRIVYTIPEKEQIRATENTIPRALRKVYNLGLNLQPIIARMVETHGSLYKDHLITVSCGFTTEKVIVPEDRRKDRKNDEHLGDIKNPDIYTGPSKRSKQTQLPLSREPSYNIQFDKQTLTDERDSVVLKKRGKPEKVNRFIELLLRSAKRGFDVTKTQSAKTGASVTLVEVTITVFSRWSAKGLDIIRSTNPSE